MIAKLPAAECLFLLLQDEILELLQAENIRLQHLPLSSGLHQGDALVEEEGCGRLAALIGREPLLCLHLAETASTIERRVIARGIFPHTLIEGEGGIDRWMVFVIVTCTTRLKKCQTVGAKK